MLSISGNLYGPLPDTIVLLQTLLPTGSAEQLARSNNIQQSNLQPEAKILMMKGFNIETNFHFFFLPRTKVPSRTLQSKVPAAALSLSPR